MGGRSVEFVSLSLLGCFGDCPECAKGIKKRLWESSDAGENASPAAAFARQSAITQREEKAVGLEGGFQQGLMEPQARSPGMAPRAALASLGAEGH